jgi:hypothetical protein
MMPLARIATNQTTKPLNYLKHYYAWLPLLLLYLFSLTNMSMNFVPVKLPSYSDTTTEVIITKQLVSLPDVATTKRFPLGSLFVCCCDSYTQMV